MNALETTLLAVGVGGILGWPIARGVRDLRRAEGLMAGSRPFAQSLNRPRHRVLVIGDSTAVGTGAQRPRESVAGRLARDFPGTAIDNLGVNGARTAELPGRFPETIPGGGYDLVLIQTGGNDILRLTPLPRLRRALRDTLHHAHECGRHVVLLSTGNLAHAPALRWPLNRFYGARTRRVRALFRDEARRADVDYVDLFRVDTADPFARLPERYFAADGLHPSSAGYGVWYRALRRHAALALAFDRVPVGPAPPNPEGDTP